MDWQTKTQIEADIRNIDRILSSGILEAHNDAAETLWTAAFRELLICLRDLLSKAERFSSRVAFNDDVVADPKHKIVDVTDLVRFARGIAGHPETSDDEIPNLGVKLSFCRIRGKGTLLQVNNLKLGSEYEDDICFLFGAHRIYLRRHLFRAFEEAKAKLLPLL